MPYALAGGPRAAAAEAGTQAARQPGSPAVRDETTREATAPVVGSAVLDDLSSPCGQTLWRPCRSRHACFARRLQRGSMESHSRPDAAMRRRSSRPRAGAPAPDARPARPSPAPVAKRAAARAASVRVGGSAAPRPAASSHTSTRVPAFVPESTKVRPRCAVPSGARRRTTADTRSPSTDAVPRGASASRTAPVGRRSSRYRARTSRVARAVRVPTTALPTTMTAHTARTSHAFRTSSCRLSGLARQRPKGPVGPRTGVAGPGGEHGPRKVRRPGTRGRPAHAAPLRLDDAGGIGPIPPDGGEGSP